MIKIDANRSQQAAKNVFDFLQKYRPELSKNIGATQEYLANLQPDLYIAKKTLTPQYTKKLKSISYKLQLQSFLKKMFETIDQKLNETKTPQDAIKYIQEALENTGQEIKTAKLTNKKDKLLFLEVLKKDKNLAKDTTVQQNMIELKDSKKAIGKRERIFNALKLVIQRAMELDEKNSTKVNYDKAVDKFISTTTKHLD